MYTAESNQTQRYCGEEGSVEFTTLGDSVIYFHSDHSVPGRVFSLEFDVTLTQLFRLVDSEGLTSFLFYFDIFILKN